jgi:hypothetical protein
MWTKNFWKQAAERAIKSAAQALIGAWTLDGVFNVLDVDLQLGAGVAGGAVVLSLLTSIVTAGMGEPGDPSMVNRTP